MLLADVNAHQGTPLADSAQVSMRETANLGDASCRPVHRPVTRSSLQCVQVSRCYRNKGKW
jgi:hypothetical protein